MNYMRSREEISTASTIKERIAKLFWIYFFIIFTIAGIYILSQLYLDNYTLNAIFFELIILYLIYIFIGGLLFLHIKLSYLLLIVVYISLSLLGIVNWGILHPYSLALLLTTIQLIFYLLKAPSKQILLLIITISPIVIGLLQTFGYIEYDFVSTSLEFTIIDLIIISGFIGISTLSANFHYKSLNKSYKHISKLNFDLENQNMELKLKLVNEINEKLSLAEKLETEEIEIVDTHYDKTLNRIENSIRKSNIEELKRIEAQDFLHQLANAIQRLFNKVFSLNLASDRLKPIVKISKEIQKEITEYKSGLFIEQNGYMNFGLNEFLQNTSEKFQDHYPNVKVTVKPISKMIKIYGPTKKLENVLYNLFHNATKADATKIKVEIVRGDHEVKLKISDNGAGISEQQFKIIKKLLTDKSFEKPLHSKGMGLGIYTSKLILGKFFKGKLEIKQSKPTTFQIMLPINK